MYGEIEADSRACGQVKISNAETEAGNCEPSSSFAKGGGGLTSRVGCCLWPRRSDNNR